MELAVISMHYTGMEAARFDAASICMVNGGVDNDWLGAVVGLASVSLLTLSCCCR